MNTIRFTTAAFLLLALSCNKSNTTPKPVDRLVSFTNNDVCNCYVNAFRSEKDIELINCIIEDNMALKPPITYLAQVKDGIITASDDGAGVIAVNIDSCLSEFNNLESLFIIGNNKSSERGKLSTLITATSTALANADIPHPNGNIGASPDEFPATSLVAYQVREDSTYWRITRMNHDSTDLKKVFSHLRNDASFTKIVSFEESSWGYIPITFFSRQQLTALEPTKYGIKLLTPR